MANVPMFYNTYTRQHEEVPEEHRDWHARDPQGFASWKPYSDSIADAGEAFSKILKPHHETFSWDNPHHYANGN